MSNRYICDIKTHYNAIDVVEIFTFSLKENSSSFVAIFGIWYKFKREETPFVTVLLPNPTIPLTLS